ncbi:ABC transporter ATP-binding protein [Alcaligenaceae bacterium]|nr:ABC transporter ATP-binding protein [Alcaligenaceae bacterium]
MSSSAPPGALRSPDTPFAYPAGATQAGRPRRGTSPFPEDETGRASAAAPVQLEDVTKTYGRQRAVDDVSFSLNPGECTVLAGHNGAGKSTLIKLILGLTHADAGRVAVFGRDSGGRGAAALRRHIGYLPETVALHPSLTGAETLDFYARLKGLPTGPNAALLARVGIAQAARRRVGGYSKGMRQRLALAQALLGQPRILLLDEPTTGLDPASRLLFYDLIRELRNAGAAILLSTHALAELEGHADRVIVMRRGKKIADGSLSDLRRQADLPVRVRLTFDFPLGDIPAGWQRMGAQRLERSCAEAGKLAILNEALALPGLADIELDVPGLDEMYAQFLRREDD